MIDCFISTLALARHEMRRDVAQRCIPAFLKEPTLRVWILAFGASPEYSKWLNRCGAHKVFYSSPVPDLSWTLEGSERRRFLFAHRLSESHVYIVADDDCLPMTDGWVERGVQILEQHSEFGMLCLDDQSVNRRLRPPLYGDDDVTETLSCGGIRFIRKGVVKKYRGYEGDLGYDRLHARSMQDVGLKVGFFKNLYRQHLGGKCSVYREDRNPKNENDAGVGGIVTQ